MAKAKSKSKAPALWVLVGGGVIIGAYYLLRPSPSSTPGKTETAPLPPVNLPSSYESLGAVRTTFEDVKTNWRMRRYDAGETVSAIRDLLDAGDKLMADGIGEENAWNELIADMNKLMDDVEDYVALQTVSA